MDDNWPGLNARIKEARGKLSQPKLAKLIDRSPGSVSNWERGERTPDPDEIRRIAEATNTDFRWLLHGESYKNPLDRIAERLDVIERAILTAVGAPPGGQDDAARRLADFSQQERDRDERENPPAQDADEGSS